MCWTTYLSLARVVLVIALGALGVAAVRRSLPQTSGTLTCPASTTLRATGRTRPWAFARQAVHEATVDRLTLQPRGAGTAPSG